MEVEPDKVPSIEIFLAFIVFLSDKVIVISMASVPYLQASTYRGWSEDTIFAPDEKAGIFYPNILIKLI